MPELDGQTANPSQESTNSESTAASSQPFWDQMDDEAAQQTPEPGAEESNDETQTATTETETTEEEEAETDYLPTEQEKVFPIETLAKYGKRYGYTLEEIQADPRIQNALKDKINSDILIRQQLDAQQTEELEPTQEEPAEANANETAQAWTPEQRTQWLEQVVTEGFDPKAVNSFGYNFLVAAGVDPNDPANKPILDNAGNVGKVMATGMVDAIATLLPQFLPTLLPNVVEQAYPKFGEMHGRTLYQLAWENVRTSDEKFASLPQYGPGLEAALKQAEAQIPNFSRVADQIQKSNTTQFEKAVSLYSLLAGHMTGTKVTPQEVQQAINTGKKAVRDAERSRAAGKVLGAGQGNKTLAPADKGAEFRSWIQEYNDSQRSTPSRS